jgi:signal transduction histidine kinase
MDNLQAFIKQVHDRLLVIVLINNMLLLADWYVMDQVLEAGFILKLVSLVIVSLFSLWWLPWFSTKYLTQPTKLIWQAVLHIAPEGGVVPAPDLKHKGIGHEMVMNIISHLYQMANVVDGIEKTARSRPADLSNNFVANSLPLPLVVLDKNDTILFANHQMLDYLKRQENDTVGQNAYSVLDLSFGSGETLDAWLATVRKNMPVAVKTWERVRLSLPASNDAPQFDLAAYYNQSNPEGFETMLVFFDKTEAYGKDDQALSFIALAVHEMRTPITVLRGYIEALEEDLEGKLDPETAGFVHKMKAAAQSLTAFINNMLNVARIENNQLTLKLREDTWPDIIKAAIDDENVRAKVLGIEISTDIAAGLPTVGVDRVSIYEVLANLISNAVKYSGKSKKVVIKSYMNTEGLVETIIQDGGPGIPASVLPNLFEKFYRSHRSRNEVGGTGLGLYLSKTIVDAHGGHIWVRSKEGGGSTFGFTVSPYAKLAEEKKTGDNNAISRGAHGWIKNHNLYSR